MKHLVFLLEEPSARDLLEGLIPRLVPADLAVYYLVFEGKQDLERKLARRLRGWRLPDSAFVVLRDQDAAECKEVKARLVGLARESGRAPVLVRVACKELESWVLGDLDAVAETFGEPSLKGLGTKDMCSFFSSVSSIASSTACSIAPAYWWRGCRRGTGARSSGLDAGTPASGRLRCSCR
jgi:hypothetical protein